MAVTATILLGGRVFGGLAGPFDLALQWIITAGVGQKLRQDLAAGANTITIPTGVKLIAIVPPAGNVQTLTAKGVTGDTGLTLNPAMPSLFSWNGTTTSLVLTAGGIVTGVEILLL